MSRAPAAASRPGDALPLRTSGLAVGYTGRRVRTGPVLAGLDLELSVGRLTCLLGVNGSGKSTLLRTLVGMQPALAGEATVLGDEVSTLDPRERARRIAVVLTDRVETGLLTAGELVALGRFPHTGWDGRLDAADHRAVDWAMEATGAAVHAERRLDELSDGERQRVLIARALAQEPQVLALDEPVAFVDVPRRLELLRLLRDLAHECRMAVLLTTHDLDLALRTADELWLIGPDGAPDAPPSVHVGAPEDLVLAGHVTRSFAGNGVVFDPLHGRVVDAAAGLVTAVVEGEGERAVWAARGLEREGLAVVRDPGAPVRVHVDGRRWVLTTADGRTVHDTIAGLLEAVRRALPTLAAAGARSPSHRKTVTDADRP